MSRNTRSGFSCRMSVMAVFPSPHSATISRSGSSCNRLRKRSRASDSSSLSNTRMDIAINLLGASAERDVNFDDAASAGRIVERHLMAAVIKLLQAGAGVAQPDPFRRNGSSEAGQSLAVVTDLHPQLVEHLAGHDANASWSAARANAVANGVFHQRLQQ